MTNWKEQIICIKFTWASGILYWKYMICWNIVTVLWGGQTSEWFPWLKHRGTSVESWKHLGQLRQMN
jgi:predicted metal-dependent enzyme (double-stranded beta helix superfamily)